MIFKKNTVKQNLNLSEMYVYDINFINCNYIYLLLHGIVFYFKHDACDQIEFVQELCIILITHVNVLLCYTTAVTKKTWITL